MFALKEFVAVAFLTTIANALTASATEIKLLFPTTMVPAMKKLVPEFEKSSGHKVVSAFANIGALTDRVSNGEMADVVIVSPNQMDDLANSKRIISGTQAIIAKTSIIAIVKKGMPKPDIGSLESFKQALRTAASITFNDPKTGGPVGVYAAAMIEKLGMTDELKAKIVLAEDGVAAVNANITNGVAQLGITQTSELVAMHDVDVVGRLPAPVQRPTVFAAGIVANGSDENASRSLIEFLTSSKAREAFSEMGLE